MKSLNTNHLVLPSGRTVANCRKDAKRLKKKKNIPHSQALDEVARNNGLDMPWDKTLDHLSKHRPSNIMTVAEIDAVLKQHPSLSHHGLGVPTRGISSIDEYLQKLKHERESLRAAVDECNKACRFITHLKKRKTLNDFASSYGLKHYAEHFLKHFPDIENKYVANGAFICAAIHMGFDFKEIRHGSLNAFFNISSKSPVIQWGYLKGKSLSLMSKRQREKLMELEEQLGIQTSTV